VWLREHPRVEVISLDRAGDFAKGGRLGAPSALQIADRWHVIQHLAQALDPALRRLGRALGFSKHTTQKKEPETKSSTPVIGLTQPSISGERTCTSGLGRWRRLYY